VFSVLGVYWSPRVSVQAETPLNLLDHHLAVASGLVGLEAQYGDPFVPARRGDRLQRLVGLRLAQQPGVVGAGVVAAAPAMANPGRLAFGLPSSRRCS